MRNICHYTVWRAARYLLENSNIYKNENIKLNTDWLNTMSHDGSSFVKEVEIFHPISEHLNDDGPTNIVTDAHSSKETSYDVSCVVTQSYNSDENNPISIQSDSSQNVNINQPPVQNVNNDNIEIDDLNEIDEGSNAIHCDTLLHEEDIPHADAKCLPCQLIYAPGEGHTPKSIFQDADMEYLAFPTFFLWTKMKRE